MPQYLIVKTYPNENTQAVVVELNDLPAEPIGVGERLMTPATYQEWLNEPEQVAWREQKAQEAEAARLAQEQAEAQAKADAIEAEIQSIMTTFNYTRQQAELLYNLQIKNASQ